MGAFVVEASVHGAKDITALVDVLSYRYAHKGFPGIEDLKPGSDFLNRLEEQEKGVSPNVKIVAIGGRAQVGGARATIAKRVFGNTEHDQVVRLRSSLPDFLDPERRIDTRCTHFEYFDEATQKGVLDQISALLKEDLIEKVPASRAARAGRAVSG